MRDFRHRTSAERLQGDFETAVTDWANRERLDAILMTRPTVGPWRDALKDVTFPFPIPVVHFIHPWDPRLWPHATAGFFKLKKALPKLYSPFMHEHEPL